MSDDEASTENIHVASDLGEPRYASFQLEELGGTRTWSAGESVCTIGSHPSAGLVIEDSTVSRFHAELKSTSRGLFVRDLESTNGLVVNGLRVTGAWLQGGEVLTLGRASVRVRLEGASGTEKLATRERFGSLVGRSLAMRACFATLERALPTDTTVLIEGETGTGKEAVAESLHALGPRSAGPFVVVDCSAIPGALLESELFGHERGAFTGAHTRRIGAFEAAQGGTVFIDELGELPAELQPKLLRVIEQRTIRRVGSNERIPVNTRIIAATHRSLRALVNSGAFRSDLYFRLAVIRLELPPLRERVGDMALLVETLLDGMRAHPDARRRLLEPGFLHQLELGVWPGNVRELRNHLERCIVMEEELLPEGMQPMGELAELTYANARDLAIARFEQSFLPPLLARHQGNVSAAARAAGIDRAYLHRLLRRHKIERSES